MKPITQRISEYKQKQMLKCKNVLKQRNNKLQNTNENIDKSTPKNFKQRFKIMQLKYYRK